MKGLLAGVAALALVVGVGAGVNHLGYLSYAYYAPRMEQVRHDTFANSEAHVEGQLHDLQNLELEWQGGTPAQKASIRTVALMRFAEVDARYLTPELRDWSAQLWSARQ